MSSVNNLQGYSRYIWSKALCRNHPFYDDYAFSIHPHDVTVPYGSSEIPRMLSQLNDPLLPIKNRILILRSINDQLADQEYKANLINHNVSSVVIQFLSCDSSKFDNIKLPLNKYDLPPNDITLALELLVIEESVLVISQISTISVGRESASSTGAYDALNILLKNIRNCWSVLYAVALCFDLLSSSRDGQIICINHGCAYSLSKFLAARFETETAGRLPILKDSSMINDDARGALNLPIMTFICAVRALGNVAKYDDGLRACITDNGLIKSLFLKINALTLLYQKETERKRRFIAESDPLKPLPQFVSKLELTSIPTLERAGPQGASLGPPNVNLLLRLICDLVIRICSHPDGRVAVVNEKGVESLTKILRLYAEDHIVYERLQRRALRTASKQRSRGIRSPPRAASREELSKVGPHSILPVMTAASVARALSLCLLSLKAKEVMLRECVKGLEIAKTQNDKDTRKEGDAIEDLWSQKKSEEGGGIKPTITSVFALLTADDIAEDKEHRIICSVPIASLVWIKNHFESFLPSMNESQENENGFVDWKDVRDAVNERNTIDIISSGQELIRCSKDCLDVAGELEGCRNLTVDWEVEIGKIGSAPYRFNIREE
eukprot:GDKJ01003536.1.p1 GENE.GDKJ01003536.1~~GDKJ01003536.1.p1  ORF type:complete len:612 (-),score=92.79 GDKJ01003536.1:49-1884(-)